MKKNNKSNNKGFSLVELIVVVAIMAVLVGVLAPQYLRYVEKSRLQKDNSAISEIAEAMKIAAADETINNLISSATDGISVTIGADTANTVKSITFNATGHANALEAELAKTIGATYSTTSNTYNKSGKAIVLTIKADTNGVVTVTATGWIETTDGTATDATNPKTL